VTRKKLYNTRNLNEWPRRIVETHESDKHQLFDDLTARHGKNPQAEAAHFLGRLDRRQQGVLGQRFDDSSDEDMLASAQYLFGSSFDEEGQI
jgi:hypothetical protein